MTEENADSVLARLVDRLRAEIERQVEEHASVLRARGSESKIIGHSFAIRLAGEAQISESLKQCRAAIERRGQAIH